MRRAFFNIFLALSVLAVFTLGTGDSLAKTKEKSPVVMSAPASFADLAERLSPAVVNISSTQKMEEAEGFPEMPQFPEGSPFQDFFEDFLEKKTQQGPSVPQSSLGSGFIIDAEKGYIVTNNHVVKDADEVRVTLHNDTTIEAEVVGRDEKTDLAVLKVVTDESLTAVPLGDSGAMRVGDWILAIGNPFGLGGTVTAGIISARQRNINAGPYDDFLQTDASINRGNSGGPMFNLAGEVIGINTAIFSPSGGSVGIGFAIPMNLSKPVIRQLIEYGHTRRGWLGVRIQGVTDEIAESLGLEKAQGALVASVTDEGPAQKAKLQTGDIILSFDGKPIDDMHQLPRIVAETPIDKKVRLSYWRDGKEQKTNVRVGELEKAEENGLLSEKEPESVDDEKPDTDIEIEELGLSFGALKDDVRDEYGIDDELVGVMITDVKSMTEAAEKGLRAGDVVIEINQHVVKNPKKVATLIRKAEKSGRNSVLFLVSRDGDVRFVALRLKTK